MNELETWEAIETLYEQRGVPYCPTLSGEVCLLSAIGVVVRSGDRSFYQSDAEVMKRLIRTIGATWTGDVAEYNDSHTKEENLALIAQCRSECAAEQTREAEVSYA